MSLFFHHFTQLFIGYFNMWKETTHYSFSSMFHHSWTQGLDNFRGEKINFFIFAAFCPRSKCYQNHSRIFSCMEEKKRQEKIDKLEQDIERRKADFKAGKALVVCPKILNRLCSSSFYNFCIMEDFISI